MLESGKSYNQNDPCSRSDTATHAVLAALEESQATPGEKARVRAIAERLLQDPEIRDTWLQATQTAIQHRLNVVAPILAVSELRATLINVRTIGSEALLGYGLIAASPEFRAHHPIAELIRPTLHDMLLRSASGESLLAFWRLAKTFRESLVAANRDSIQPRLRLLSDELAELSLQADEARWFFDQVERYVTKLDAGQALTRTEELVECIALSFDLAGQDTHERYFGFLRRSFAETPSRLPFEVTSLALLVAPLLRREDVPKELIDRYVSLASAPAVEAIHSKPPVSAEAVRALSSFIADFADAQLEKLWQNAALLAAYVAGDPGFRNIGALDWVSGFSRKLESLNPERRPQALALTEVVLSRLSGERLSFGSASTFIDRTLALSGRSEFFDLLKAATELHGDSPPVEQRRIHANLEALVHPLAPLDLVRTYLDAMEQERFRNASTSSALLDRLGLHAAVYVLPEARTVAQLADLLRNVGAISGRHPHAFLQEEPDARAYRELQSNFYPEVRGIYQRDAESRPYRADEQKPFSLLIPPLQRSLGAYLRVLDVHHGFGVQAVLARRTPDGEIPLLLRFGQRHGRVSMLNASDNRSFPGKGFIIRELNPEGLFAARPEGFHAGQDPFALYRSAWPSIGPNIARLPRAEFLFSRGMLAIVGVDPDYFSLSVGGKTLQYSLVIFNAHFENPFNEVAQLVPTQILREFFRGTLAPLDDFTGFNSKRANAVERIPNSRTFMRHRELGRYVINVGLPERVLSGLSDSRQNEFEAWYRYRHVAMDYEGRMRMVDRGFARRALRFAQFAQPRELRAAERLLSHEHALDLSEYLAEEAAEAERRRNRIAKLASRTAAFEYMAGMDDTVGVNLFRGESRLIAERPGLIERFEKLDSVVDGFERSVWRCVNRLMDQYDVFRIGFAYETRGMTRSTNFVEAEAPEVQLGDAEDAGFNPGGELMLQELYRGHSMRELDNVPRHKYWVLVVGDALYSSRYEDPVVMIDSYDMRGFAGPHSIRFSKQRMDEADLGVWQAGIMPLIQDTAGRIPEIRLVERGMLPADLVEKLDRMKKGGNHDESD